MPAEDGAGGYVITEDFVLAMLSEFKEQRLIHRRFAFQILLQVRLAI
jgi:serine/threonine-protein phosphatase 5